jgi:transcriptional regulator with XRE-family HTH domain
MSEPQGSRTSGLIDNHVGARIRERRTMLGLTQQQFAEKIGVSYPQAYKYEHGINCISAGRLYEIAAVLDAPITYFYEGVDDVQRPQLARHQRMLLEIARNFAAIPNEQHREALSQLVRILAGR